MPKSSIFDHSIKSKNERINEVFKSRKQQIDNELNRIKQLLLNESVTEVSLDIHISFDKNIIKRIWSSGSGSELTFVDQVKKEVKCKELKTDDW